MARRKNTKRIDPRYFLNETVNRNDDGSRLEEETVAEEADKWKNRSRTSNQEWGEIEEGLRGHLEPAIVDWVKKNPKAAKALKFIGLDLRAHGKDLADAIEFVFLGPKWGPEDGPLEPLISFGPPKKASSWPGAWKEKDAERPEDKELWTGPSMRPEDDEDEEE